MPKDNLEGVIDRLREVYPTLDSKGRQRLLTRIHLALNGETPNLFNGEEARRIRLEKDYSDIKSLVEDLFPGLGFFETRSTRTAISNYESGNRRPEYPPRGKVTPVYLKWLKDNGYDPFGL